MQKIVIGVLALIGPLVLSMCAKADAAASLLRISADRISFYYDHFVLEADGNVRVTTSDGMTITGDAFSMDLRLNRFLIASRVHLHSKGGDLNGAAIADFLDFDRVYFIPVTSEPDHWTYENGDFTTPIKGREMPGDTFAFPQLGNAKPDMTSHEATIGPKSYIRLSRPTSDFFGMPVPLPSYYVYFGSGQYLAQNSLSGASFDVTYNATGNSNYITALHLRYDPVNHTYLSFEQHFAGAHEYAVFSVNPATTNQKYWNLMTGDKLGKTFQINTFTQLFTAQTGPSQPTPASAQSTYITMTKALPQSYLSAYGVFTNYNMYGPQAAAIPNHPNQFQITSTTFNHRVGKLPLYEQTTFGFGFNHDAYGLQEFGGYNYTTIWNHTAGFTFYTPSVKLLGDRDNTYKTYYFNATFSKNRQWFTVPHYIDTANTTASISRTFSRPFNAYTSYSVSNTGDYYITGTGYGYPATGPLPPGISPSLAAFRGVATFRTATLGMNYTPQPNFYAGLTFQHHQDFPIPVPGEFAPPQTNFLGQYLYSTWLGQPPNNITGEVRVKLFQHFIVDVQRTYYFNFGTLKWSPTSIIQITPQ